jgi:hypothetical protein
MQHGGRLADLKKGGTMNTRTSGAAFEALALAVLLQVAGGLARAN